MVPASLDTIKGSESCQHSRIESPLAAEMAVRFKKEGAAMVVANS